MKGKEAEWFENPPPFRCTRVVSSACAGEDALNFINRPKKSKGTGFCNPASLSVQSG
jgi:hypothetical protein